MTFPVVLHCIQQLSGIGKRVIAALTDDGKRAPVVPARDRIVRMALGACILRPMQEEHILLLQLLCKRLQLFYVPVGELAEARRRARLAPVAKAVAVSLAAHLKPETRRVGAPLQLVLKREPDVILERPAAEQPSGIAVDLGDVQIQMQVGIGLRQPVVKLARERLGRGHNIVVELFLARVKPLAGIIEADVPEEIHGLVAVACKHASCYSLCVRR